MDGMTLPTRWPLGYDVFLSAYQIPSRQRIYQWEPKCNVCQLLRSDSDPLRAGGGTLPLVRRPCLQNFRNLFLKNDAWNSRGAASGFWVVVYTLNW